jgi:hypothetical protein
MLKRRLMSLAIYAVAALLVIALVRVDQEGARQRAHGVIEACEDYRKAKGVYPMVLDNLVPGYLATVPKARRLGWAGDRDFHYYESGQNSAVSQTNRHLLVYVRVAPFGKSYYVFEEARWGSLD